MGCQIELLLLQWQSSHWGELVAAALRGQKELCEVEKVGGGGKGEGGPVTEEEDVFSSMVCSEHWSFLL